jgi:predicted SAM-dependent methyltransferase
MRRRVRLISLRPYALRRLRQFSSPFRLHLGCGGVKLAEWINVDIAGDPATVDVYWDLTESFPLPDGSCSHIFSEHVLEHFDVGAGVAILCECYRLLSSKGTLRIAMPSLESLVCSYQSKNWRRQDWVRRPEHQFIQTSAEMLNVAFRWWGHRWLYDREELHRRLGEAGFHDIRDAAWGRSTDPALQSLETRLDSGLIVEARK